MKSIQKYINESSKRFKLEQNEREALAAFMGILCGNIGDEDDLEPMKVITDQLSQQELEQVSELAEFLDDIEVYKSANNNNMKDNIELIKKIYNIAVDNDLLEEQWDLIDAFEKICL